MVKFLAHGYKSRRGGHVYFLVCDKFPVGVMDTETMIREDGKYGTTRRKF